MQGAFLTHYLVVEGVAGGGAVWHVVRAEEVARGRRLYAFVGACQTRRAANALARALNEKRAVPLAAISRAIENGPSPGSGREA